MSTPNNKPLTDSESEEDMDLRPEQNNGPATMSTDLTSPTASGNTGNTPAMRPDGRFVPGDPRMNRNGRPKSFDALRSLAQQIAHEPRAGPLDDFLVVNGKIVTNVEWILRQMVEDKDQRLKFLEVAFGKVPDQIQVDSTQTITWKSFIGSEDPDKPKLADPDVIDGESSDLP